MEDAKLAVDRQLQLVYPTDEYCAGPSSVVLSDDSSLLLLLTLLDGTFNEGWSGLPVC